MDLQNLTAEDFEAYRGSLFRASVADEDVDLWLIEIEPLAVHGEVLRRAPFSLTFSGPSKPFLEQRTYALEHQRLGQLDIFLVPIGYDRQGGVLYEAVFN